MRRVALAVVAIAGLAVACTAASYPDYVAFDGVDAELWRGREHCDWDNTWQILIESDDLQGRTSNPGWHMFVRDPAAVPEYTYATSPDLHRVRPSDSERIGSSTDGYELWFSASDPDYIHIESHDSTEAWVRATNWHRCI